MFYSLTGKATNCRTLKLKFGRGTIVSDYITTYGRYPTYIKILQMNPADFEIK